MTLFMPRVGAGSLVEGGNSILNMSMHEMDLPGRPSTGNLIVVTVRGKAT